MSTSISVDHTFEAGHRLPHIPGKCTSLHGHSWRVKVVVCAPAPDDRGMVVEFGPFKQTLRQWIDTHLDHGLMLGATDPLAPVLAEHGKVFQFYEIDGQWPTVENVAQLIGRVATEILLTVPAAPEAFVAAVDLQETTVNGAMWMPNGFEQ